MQEYKGNLVSVVVTTRNRPFLLKKALDTVFSQTYNPIEVVVVDDFSRSNISKTIRVYMKRITFIRNRRCLGSAASRMVGAEKANGQYIAFLDDDDQWVSSKIEKQVHLAKNSGKDCAVITCGVKYYSENEIYYSYPTLNGDIRDNLFVSGFKTMSSCHLFSRKLFDKIGGYDWDMPAHEEHDIWMKLARDNYETRILHEPLVEIYEYQRDRKMTNVKNRLLAYQLFERKWIESVYTWYGLKQGRFVFNNYLSKIHISNAGLVASYGDVAGARIFAIKSIPYILKSGLNVDNFNRAYQALYHLFPKVITDFYGRLKNRFFDGI